MASDGPEIGYDAPAMVGMDEDAVQTPCLMVDLDAFERNVEAMRARCAAFGVALRAHGKMHKSADAARYQIEKGGAVGLCCQKVSEAEAFARAGVGDLLISNEVRDPLKLDRLSRLAARPEVRVGVCVDALDAVADLSAAAVRHGAEIRVLVEIECGQGRCGAAPGAPAAAIAAAVDQAPGLVFDGVQAYHGGAQHFADSSARAAAIGAVISHVEATLAAIRAAGLACRVVTGGGTGTFALEAGSGLFTEVQCGSYAFMDAAYARALNAEGAPPAFEHALFLLTSVMSVAGEGRAVCDAGLKVQSVDSGPPLVFGRDDVAYLSCSDEHGVLSDPAGALRINERLRLIPGHCDPTCNLHDWYVGVRGGVVETLWPVTARGKAY